jgi:hypothetical protein
MNLLDTASLVVTPNGYKASKLYSIVPSDGTGDMTFARTGDTATRVNSSGLIESVTANKPRLDYLGSTCPKLLLEPQRTNGVSYSNDFTNGNYTPSGITVAGDFAVSPDGGTNADKFTAVAGSGFKQLIRNIGILSGSQTFSFFAKAGTKDFIFLSIYSSDAFNGGFKYQDTTITLSTQGIVTGGTISPTITTESYGNGWYRIKCTFTANNNGTLTINFGLSKSSTQPSGTFDGSETSYFYGAQLEAGAYATSYIPTTTASVTRNVDLSYKTGITSLIGQTEGTIFLHANIDAASTEEGQRFICISDYPTNTNRIEILKSAGKFYIYVASSSTEQWGVTTTQSIVGNCKIALAYKNNDAIFYVNGVQIASDSTFTVPACSVLLLGTSAFDTSSHIGLAKYNSAALWKTRLTNQELVTLTTI